MADTTEGAAAADVTFKVKASGEKNHTITMSEAASVADLKTKLATEEFENIPIERQRLIYSGRVMKNEETLGSYKIKAGNTVHLVKSAASNPTPAPSSAASQPVPALPNMAAGTPANNPFAALTGARYAGLNAPMPNANLFGADGGMGAPPNEDAIADMLSDPSVVQELARQLENPAVIDQMIQMNPMLRNNPQAREMIQSPMFRAMLTNPETIRAMGAMRGMGGGPGAAAAFPAPGATDNTPAGAPATGAEGGANNAQAPPNPFAGLGGAGLGGAGANNPFAALFGPGAGQAPGAGQGGAAGAAANPFAGITPEAMQAMMPHMQQMMPHVTPEMMQQAMAMMGPGGGFGGMGGGMGAFGAPPAAPADTRPPEERYADQLQQLNEMGFFDFDQNVSALRRSGGNVQGAVNFLLGG